jgi:hypothetical protein
MNADPLAETRGSAFILLTALSRLPSVHPAIQPTQVQRYVCTHAPPENVAPTPLLQYGAIDAHTGKRDRLSPRTAHSRIQTLASSLL